MLGLDGREDGSGLGLTERGKLARVPPLRTVQGILRAQRTNMEPLASCVPR